MRRAPEEMRQTSRLASVALYFLAIDVATRAIFNSGMALAMPQQQQQYYHADVDTSKRNVTRVEARLRDKVELTCVIPEGQVFRGWRHRRQDARQVPGITSSREMHDGMLSEKLIINNFHLGLAGEYVCVRAKEATPDVETTGIIDLYLRRDGLESVDAAAPVLLPLGRWRLNFLLAVCAGAASTSLSIMSWYNNYFFVNDALRLR